MQVIQRVPFSPSLASTTAITRPTYTLRKDFKYTGCRYFTLQGDDKPLFHLPIENKSAHLP